MQLPYEMPHQATGGRAALVPGWPNPRCWRGPASRNGQSSPCWWHQVPLQVSLLLPRGGGTTPEEAVPAGELLSAVPQFSKDALRVLWLASISKFPVCSQRWLEEKLINWNTSPVAEIFPSQVMRLTNRSHFCQMNITVAHHLTKWSLYSFT